MGCCVSNLVAGKEEKEKLRLKKNQVEELLSAEAKNDVILRSVPGRLVTNGVGNAVVVHTQQGAKGINQDAVVVWEGFRAAGAEDDDGDDYTVFCGVFDGHGPFGHLAAQRVRDSLPSKLIHYWQEQLAAIKSSKEADTTTTHEKNLGAKTKEMGDDDDDERTTATKGGGGGIHEAATTNDSRAHEAVATTNGDVHEAAAAAAAVACNGFNTAEIAKKNAISQKASLQGDSETGIAMFEAWKKPHLAAYKIMDKELQLHPDIDCFCSGTTSVTLLKQGEHLVIGNLGDSRAVMGTKDENGNLVPVQLTVDLKPTVPQEADRIHECKGRVYALKNEPHLQRVWLPHEEAPGLAMSRTFGDFCLKEHGIIAVPELSYRQLTDRDQFVVLATDGIWDVLSNEEVVKLIASAPTRATAACTLVEGAIRVWQLKFPSAKIDDCAVACIYLNDTTVPISQNSKSKEEAADAIETSQAVSNATEILKEEEGACKEARQMPLQSKLVELSSSGDDHDHDHDHEEWLALKGITHANSLTNLPSLLLQPDKMGS